MMRLVAISFAAVFWVWGLGAFVALDWGWVTRADGFQRAFAVSLWLLSAFIGAGLDHQARK